MSPICYLGTKHCIYFHIYHFQQSKQLQCACKQTTDLLPLNMLNFNVSLFLIAVSSLDEESKWSVHYTATLHQQENVFLPGSRPACVEDLHRQAKVNLKTVLRGQRQKLQSFLFPFFSFLNAKYNLNSRSSDSFEDQIQHNCFTYNLQIQNALQKNVISLLQTVDHYNEDNITTVQKVLLHNRFTL